MKTNTTTTASLPVKINGVILEGGLLVKNDQTGRLEPKRLNIDCTGFTGDLLKWKDDNENAIIAALEGQPEPQPEQPKGEPKSENDNIKIPEIGQIIKFNDAEHILLSINLGGKCKIKKLNLPNKGRILKNIDISELSI